MKWWSVSQCVPVLTFFVFFRGKKTSTSRFHQAQGLFARCTPWRICQNIFLSPYLNISNDSGSKMTAVKDDLKEELGAKCHDQSRWMECVQTLSFYSRNTSGKKPVELLWGRGSLKHTHTHTPKKVIEETFCSLQSRWHCTDLKLSVDKSKNTKAWLPMPIDDTAKHVFHHGKPPASFCVYRFSCYKKIHHPSLPELLQLRQQRNFICLVFFCEVFLRAPRLSSQPILSCDAHSTFFSYKG